MFAYKKKPQQEVTTGRFEIEEDGHVAFLEYTIAGRILALVHTEVPEELRGRGLASVADFLERHKEYSDLVLH